MADLFSAAGVAPEPAEAPEPESAAAPGAPALPEMADIMLVTITARRVTGAELARIIRTPGQVAIEAAQWDRADLSLDELARALVRSVNLGRMFSIIAGAAPTPEERGDG